MTNEFIFGYNHLTQLVDIADGVSPDNYDRDKLGFTFKSSIPMPTCGIATRDSTAGSAAATSGLRQRMESTGSSLMDRQSLVRSEPAHIQDRHLSQYQSQRPATRVTDSINLNFA